MLATRIDERNTTMLEQLRAELTTRQMSTFRLKISRQPNEGGMVEPVATLDQALPRHMTSPETWLPKFSGGGRYHLLPCTPDDNEERLCANPLFVAFTIPPAPPAQTQPDTEIVIEGWDGPSVLHSVNEALLPPPAPKNGNSAVQTGPQSPAPAIVHQTPKTGREYDALTEAKLQLERDRAQIALERAQMAADNEKNRLQLEIEATKRQAKQAADESASRLKILEEKNETTLQRMQASFDAKFDALQQKLNAPIAAPQENKQVEMMMQMMKENNQAAIARAEADAARAREDAKAAKEQARADAEIARQHAKELIEAQTKPSPHASMMEDLMKTTSSIMQNVLNLAQLRADLAPPAPEAPAGKSQMVEVIDAVGSAVEKIGGQLFKAAQLRQVANGPAAGMTARQATGQQPRQLAPAQVQPAQPQPKPAPQAAAPVTGTPAQTPAPTPEAKRPPAPGPHPDKQVQRLINLIAAFTSPPKLEAELNTLADQSEAENGTFHKRALFNEEFYQEVTPYLQPWYERDEQAALKYLNEINAHFEELQKRMVAQQANPPPQNAAPEKVHTPEIVNPNQAPPAAEREPAAVE
jgi:hypothetical protein